MNEPSTSQNNDPQDSQPLASMKTLTGVIYLLQALGILTGGITPFIAVAINYWKRDAVKGTWLESHFAWQIKTFWFVLILEVVGVVTLALGIGALILTAAAIFLVFRVYRGWMRLSISRPIEETEL